MADPSAAGGSSRPRVALIDYGSGNLRSVEKAMQQAGAAVTVCAGPEELDSCAAVVLPGVGSFGDCMRSLEARGLSGPLKAWVEAGRPYLGICLGYQILFEGSEESPGVEGFGFWPGKVVRFANAPELKVPHMGWNDLEWRAPDAMFRGITEPAYVYFVHSYYPAPGETGIVTAVSRHGVGFAAACGAGVIRGVQFHPEKSQQTGLQMLGNFVATLEEVS